MTVFRHVYAALVLAMSSAACAQTLEESFACPPAVAMPGVWWRWIDGNITREGITRDLTEMARKGIRSVDIFDVGGGLPAGPAAMMGAQWRGMFQHTLAEAARLGIEVRVVAAAGWGMGGPWVDAAHAAKKLAYAEIQVDGPRHLSTTLPRPLGDKSFYQDVAVIAFREKGDAPLRPSRLAASSEAGNYCTDEHNWPVENLSDCDPDTCWKPKAAPSAENPAWIDVHYHEPLEAAALLVVSPAGCGPRSCEVQASTDGKAFTKVAAFELAAGENRRVNFVPVKAKVFRLQMTSAHVPDVQLAELCVLRPGDEPRLRRGIKWWLFKSGTRSFWDWPKEGPAVLADEYDGADVADCRRAETLELTAKMDAAGVVSWDVPPGRWTLARFGMTLVGEPPRAMSAALKGGYEADPYSRKVADLLYDSTAKVLLAEAGPEARKALKGVLLDSYEIGAAVNGLQATWTEGFREEFRRRNNYDLIAYLPALMRRVVDGRRETGRFFWDYRQVLAGLYLDFYSQMTARANQDGLRMRAENGYGSYPFPHIDGLAAYGRIDEPMGEFWFNDGGPWGLVMKQHFPFADSVRTAASASRIYGKSLVAAESLTIADGTRQSPGTWKAELDAQFCNGMNHAMLHLWSHQPDIDARPGLFTYDAINANMTWWEQSDAFLNYLGRCQLLLRQGRFVADFCYFFGEDTARFVPGRRQVRPALPAGYDFDGINAEVILSRLACKQGLATLPDGQAYRYLVLPTVDAWPVTLPVLEKLLELVGDGLTVIGARPGASPRLMETVEEGRKRQKLVDGLWGAAGAARVDRHVGKGRVIAGMPLAELLASERLASDVAPCGAPEPGWEEVSWIHRRSEDAEFYFLANAGTGSVRQAVSFRVTGRRPELWDPLTGARRALPEWSASKEVTTVPLFLEPSGSLFVLFRERDQRTEVRGQKGEKNFPELKQVMELAGPWQVTFDPKWLSPVSGPQSAVVFETLTDWTLRPEEAIRYYSGTATYRKTFDFPPASSFQFPVSNLFLDLGVVHNVVRVRLNKHDLGTVWCAPWRVDVMGLLKPGENQLELDVVNLWNNRLVGDAAQLAGQRLTRTNLAIPANRALLPSGLLGPVRLVTAADADNVLLLHLNETPPADTSKVAQKSDSLSHFSIELIGDPHGERGVKLKSVNPGPAGYSAREEGILRRGEPRQAPIWRLMQAYSKQSIGAVEPVTLAAGQKQWTNAYKEFMMGHGSPDADFVLAVNSIEEYGNHYRSAIAPWPHLLLEQDICVPGGHLSEAGPSLADCRAMTLRVSVKLRHANNLHERVRGYSEGIHAAQFLLYFTLQNLNRKSSGYGKEYVWFGVPFYDDRYPVISPSTMRDGTGQEDERKGEKLGTGRFINSIGTKAFAEQGLVPGTWQHIHIDLLPLMKEALERAWSRGICNSSTNFADYKIGSMNIGWEMPGLSSVSAQFKDLSLLATGPKTRKTADHMSADSIIREKSSPRK
jgi:hypothetical protein